MKFFALTILIFILNSDYVFCQVKADSSDILKGSSSVNTNLSDTVKASPNQFLQSNKKRTYREVVSNLLSQNKSLNTKSGPESFINKERNPVSKDFMFYQLMIVILLIGIFKAFYSGYFNNIFRVFFNTSLRQNQLTDIMLQARLPSLIFNFFFIVIAGLYIWLLLNHYESLPQSNNELLIITCIGSLGIIYLGKFFILKFIGWVSGMSDSSDTYIFIIYLINKIIGIVLIPFLVLLAFAPDSWKDAIIILSYLVVGLFFLLRFFRSYGLLQNRLSISGFHFLLYIVAVEILPIFIIYKLLFYILLKI